MMVTRGFSGCFAEKLTKKRAKAQMKVLQAARATAYFVGNLKKSIISGMATSLPPMPARLARAIRKAKAARPPYSEGCMGKMCLWTHLPVLASIVLPFLMTYFLPQM